MSESRTARSTQERIEEKPRGVKWLIDTIQEIGTSEQHGFVPGVIFSVKWHAFTTGLHETLSRSMSFVITYYFLEMVFFVAQLLTGYHFLRIVFWITTVLAGIILFAKPFGKFIFTAGAVKNFITGEHSRKVWKWFTVGIAAGYLGGFLVFATLLTIFKIGLITFLNFTNAKENLVNLLLQSGLLEYKVVYKIAAGVVWFLEYGTKIFFMDLLVFWIFGIVFTIVLFKISLKVAENKRFVKTEEEPPSDMYPKKQDIFR